MFMRSKSGFKIEREGRRKVKDFSYGDRSFRGKEGIKSCLLKFNFSEQT